MHFDNKAAAKRLDDKAHECDVLRAALAKSDANVKQLTTVVDELNAAIRKLDDEAADQRRKLGQLVTERDILGAQLVRRNDELALLYEKVDIQASVLRKGEAQYLQRVEDIRVLKLKVGELRRALQLERRKGNSGDELRREVARLQRELLQESTKVKALSEELENPMNVHRWRRLEGSDPATFELIQKVQTLQRRLISKTEEVVERDLLLADKEKMYVQLKEVLKRQPGPEVAERLAAFQQALRDKTRQLRSMASELNMQQALSHEYKFEMDRLTRDLHDAKRKYFAHRRKEAIAGQRAAAAAATEGKTDESAAGGGGSRD
jgi:chromosome segregation ATPase